MSRNTTRRSLGLDIRKVKSPPEMARAVERQRSGDLDRAREIYVRLVQRHGDHPEAKYMTNAKCSQGADRSPASTVVRPTLPIHDRRADATLSEFVGIRAV